MAPVRACEELDSIRLMGQEIVTYALVGGCDGASAERARCVRM